MTRAEICIPRTLRHEGGFVNDDRDPGGATNKGVTITTFRRYIKPSGSVADLKALTDAQAFIVYKRQYWDTVCADMLPNGIDFATFDFGVHSGPSRAARYLQKVVGVPVDGRVGPVTIAAVKQRDPEEVVNALCDGRLAFLKRLGIWRHFAKGLGNRVSRVRAEALGDCR